MNNVDISVREFDYSRPSLKEMVFLTEGVYVGMRQIVPADTQHLLLQRAVPVEIPPETENFNPALAEKMHEIYSKLYPHVTKE